MDLTLLGSRYVVVALIENTSVYIFGAKTFKVVKEKGTEFNTGQHFDLSKFEFCAKDGIKVLVL